MLNGVVRFWKPLVVAGVGSLLLFGLVEAALHQIQRIEEGLEEISDLRDPSPFRVALLGYLDKIHLSVKGHLSSHDPSLVEQAAGGEREFEKSLPEFERQNSRLLPPAAGTEILLSFQPLKASADGVLGISAQRWERIREWETNFQQMLSVITRRLRPLAKRDRANGSVRQNALLNIENQLRAWRQTLIPSEETPAARQPEDSEPESRGMVFLDTYEQIADLPAESRALHTLRALWNANAALAREFLTLRTAQDQALARLDADLERVHTTLSRRLPAMPTEEFEKKKQGMLRSIRLHFILAGLSALSAIVALAGIVIGVVRLTKKRPALAASEPEKPKAPEEPTLEMDLKGMIVGWSQAAVDFYGYSPEEIRGQSIVKLFSSESEMGRLSKQIGETKKAHFETIHLAKNGVAIPVRMDFRHQLDANGRLKAIGLFCHRR